MITPSQPTGPTPIREYVEAALYIFDNEDPSDTNYQKGYEDCLREIKKCIDKGMIK
jgi:hypothetical protein